MRLDDVADHIQTGDVLLFSGSAFYSRLIKLWTKSRYSHVGVVLKFQVGGITYLDVIEAVEGTGVRQYPLHEYLSANNCRIDWYSIVDQSIDRPEVANWFLQRRSKRYASPRQLIRSFVTAPLLAWLQLPTKIDEDRYFCSFATTAALKAGGWRPAEDDSIAPELAAPGDVALFTCLQRQGPLTL